jgi:hypothetical protein
MMSRTRLANTPIDHGTIRVGHIARYMLESAQAWCEQCKLYLTVFDYETVDNVASALDDLETHLREFH